MVDGVQSSERPLLTRLAERVFAFIAPGLEYRGWTDLVYMVTVLVTAAVAIAGPAAWMLSGRSNLFGPAAAVVFFALQAGFTYGMYRGAEPGSVEAARYRVGATWLLLVVGLMVIVGTGVVLLVR